MLPTACVTPILAGAAIPIHLATVTAVPVEIGPEFAERGEPAMAQTTKKAKRSKSTFSPRIFGTLAGQAPAVTPAPSPLRPAAAAPATAPGGLAVVQSDHELHQHLAQGGVAELMPQLLQQLGIPALPAEARRFLRRPGRKKR
jgi:hypothetical protein